MLCSGTGIDYSLDPAKQHVVLHGAATFGSYKTRDSLEWPLLPTEYYMAGVVAWESRRRILPSM